MIYSQIYGGWKVWFSPSHRVKHRAAVKPLIFNLPLGSGWQKRNCLLEGLGSEIPTAWADAQLAISSSSWTARCINLMFLQILRSGECFA